MSCLLNWTKSNFHYKEYKIFVLTTTLLLLIKLAIMTLCINMVDNNVTTLAL